MPASISAVSAQFVFVAKFRSLFRNIRTLDTAPASSDGRTDEIETAHRQPSVRSTNSVLFFMFFLFSAEIYCPPLAPPANGRLFPLSCNGTKALFGDQCRYRCQEGHRLTGPAARECIYPGVWTDRETITRCIGRRPVILLISLGRSPEEQ